MTSEQSGDAAAPRPTWLALMGIVIALVAIAVVGWWQFSGEAPQDAHEQRDPGSPVDEFTKAIELKPGDPKAYLGRGINYAETGDLDRAIADFTKAIALKPDDAEAYNARGDAYRKKADYDRAIADLTKAVEFNPRLAEAYLSRGLAYRKKGDHDRATGDLIGAVVLDPNGPVGRQATEHMRETSE
ncbi:MAG: tetratricopeptide repeat protein [Planctomycetota bacterium]